MTVVLAGAGEIDLVVGLGRQDPEPSVRAAAMRLVVRFAAAERAPWDPIAHALASDDDDVRIAILGELPADVPANVRLATVSCLAHSAVEVQLAALDTALPVGPEIRTLRDGIVRAPRLERARLLDRWLALTGEAEVIDALAGAPVEVVRDLLDRVKTPTWALLAPLASDDPAICERLERMLAGQLETVPARVLVSWGVILPDLALWLTAPLAEAIDRDGVADIDARDRAAFCQRLDEACRELADREIVVYEDDEDDDEWETEEASATLFRWHRLRELLA